MDNIKDAMGSGYNAKVEAFRDEEYPMLKGTVYLDHAGTTPYPKSLMDLFVRDMTSNLYGNPHSGSSSSQLSTSRIEDIRLRVLQFFNADPEDFDVVFVANATAGIKLVVDALRAGPDGFDYAYHQASHTSLVGVREEARNSLCLDDRQVEAWVPGHDPFEGHTEDRPVLFAYPAQSNMDGSRFPLGWSETIRQRTKPEEKRTYTLLDAAAYVCSSPLDLSCADSAPDFTVLSFYKIFGFPDLGALIVRRQAEEVFNATKYFGGGTVDMVVCVKEQWHAPKSQFLHERLEHGTLPIHNIIALDAALDTHNRLFGTMEDVSTHTTFLHTKLDRGLRLMQHRNGMPVCSIYSPESGSQLGNGPVVAFNIRNSQGAWVSLAEIEKLATLKGFHIRTGGVCNPGGIASALALEPWEMRQNFSSGFRCGTDNDIMAGKPTGVIRASLGAMSTISDVDAFVDFIAEFYQDLTLTPALTPPTALPTRPPELCVHSISIYPIKSCGNFQVPAGVDWEVRPEGLAWDREWCLVHQGTGQALSQKRYPKMALIRPTLDFGRGELRVRYIGKVPSHLPREISIPLSKNPSLFRPPTTPGSRPSRVCGEEILAQTYVSTEINEFFSGALGVPCILARFPPGGQGKSMRHSKAHLQKHQLPLAAPAFKTPKLPGSFPGDRPPSPPDSDTERSSQERRILLSNESPILAITLPSLDALNAEVRRTGSHRGDISPDVFRANIVIAPTSRAATIEPYVEDTWSSLRIGDGGHRFEMLGSCRRCHMVCINQDTAEKSEEPFVTLSKTRRFDGKVFFGVHMAATNQAGVPTLRVGDVVVSC
ncbi:putative molybdenum cofactor sulfurase [Triangularia verruculosa]|uniref:Molybdenum cofactor sulfurase n=1 Tax=Triangularia verruculosa TaxID=2587418 RepID=A0AAN6XK68_9PEZI|nr:putative molybdenum cofactor sulfurase [Triangularia verruculosa]